MDSIPEDRIHAVSWEDIEFAALIGAGGAGPLADAERERIGRVVLQEEIAGRARRPTQVVTVRAVDVEIRPRPRLERAVRWIERIRRARHVVGQTRELATAREILQLAVAIQVARLRADRMHHLITLIIEQMMALLALIAALDEVIERARRAFEVDERRRNDPAAGHEHRVRLLGVPEIGICLPARRLMNENASLDEVDAHRGLTKIGWERERLGKNSPDGKVEDRFRLIGGARSARDRHRARFQRVIREERRRELVGHRPGNRREMSGLVRTAGEEAISGEHRGDIAWLGGSIAAPGVVRGDDIRRG